MGGGTPFEHNREEDCMHVHAGGITSPSEPTTLNNQANKLQQMELQLMKQNDPTDTKGSSCPADEAYQLAGPANKVLTANFQHDVTHNLTKQAEQSNSVLASTLGFPSHFHHASPFLHHSNLPGAHPIAFHLMDVVSDKQDLSFVEKVQVLEAEILKLCITLAPACAKGKDAFIASIDFEALNSQSASIIGFYGDKQFLTKIIQEKNLAPSSLVRGMYSNCLRSGLYACVNGDGKLYLFYWDARDQFVEASRKDVSCNFVRYLIDLCEVVFVCLNGKTMEEALNTKVSIPSNHQKRTQRLQVSMRKESENDLRLHKGFNIDLNPTLCLDHFMVRLPQGLHRCLVLAASLNVPKLISRKCSKTDTPANLQAWIESQATVFALDCCQLNDKEFLLLLKVLGKHEELQKYSQAEKVWKDQQLEVGEKLQRLDLTMKEKKKDLLSAFRSAMEYTLLQKHPWEESLLATADSSQPKLQSVQEGTKGSALSQPHPNCSHLKYEAELCGVWSDRNDFSQRFLYSGSQVEIASLEKDGEQSAPGVVYVIGKVFTLNRAVDGQEYSGKECMQSNKTIESSNMADGPVCFGQQFVLTSKYVDSHANSMQECIAHFSQAEGSILLNYVRVILNGETKLILNLAVRNRGELVVVRHAGGGDLGLIMWLKTFCNGPMSLQQNAAALSYLIRNMDGKGLDDKLLEKLLKEPLKKWPEMNCLSVEGSSVLMESLAENQNKTTHIQEHISKMCASIYKDARQKSFMAVEAFVNNEIRPALRQHLQKQLQKQMETMRTADDMEVKALLSHMKAQLFTPIEKSSEKSEKKCKLLLSQLQWRSRSVMESVQYMFTRTDKMTITYVCQELEAETLTWHAIEMVPKKGDLDELMTNPCSGRVVVPVCGKPAELITLNPKLESLSAVVMVKSGQVLVFVEPVDKSCLHLYYYPRLGGFHMGSNPSRIFKRGCDLWSFDELSRFLALYDRNYGSIKIFRFDEAYHHMEWTGSDIQLSKYSGSSSIVWMELVPGKREILLGDDENRLRICELASCMMKARHIILPSPIRKACIIPDGSCLIVFSASTDSHDSQVDVDSPWILPDFGLCLFAR
ncbi:hypothetical protein L7F22_030814 [Adiantum nelumboides]|nr:hypothetical protein [Adiantum nelumboides]